MYVVKPDNTVLQRLVKLGPAEGVRVAVSEGLAVGETVVTDGVDRLRPGSAVRTSSARPEIKPPPQAGKKRGKKKAQ